MQPCRHCGRTTYPVPVANSPLEEQPWLCANCVSWLQRIARDIQVVFDYILMLSGNTVVIRKHDATTEQLATNESPVTLPGLATMPNTKAWLKAELEKLGSKATEELKPSKPAKTRYKLDVVMSSMNSAIFVKIMTRQEHVDMPGNWKEVWTTEAYTSETKARKRARLWVKENLPDAVE